MRVKNKLAAILLSSTIVLSSAGYCTPTVMMTAEAHSGRTDANGGHRDNQNKSGLGSYHYHCGGYPAHLHTNGVCPYSSSATKSNTSKTSAKSNSSQSSELVKKVQRALNKKGYNCGTVDGIYGQKTKNAIKKYQKNNKLTVNGKITKQLKKALKIS